MSPDTLRHATALIQHIQTRFHDGHRAALPPLLGLAAAVEARGIDTGLVDTLRSIGNALEQHMFKEEMRLFPMMEHGAHEAAMDDLRARLAALGRAHGAEPALQQLIQGVEALAEEGSRHIRAEDDELFPLFALPQRTAAGDRTTG